jgi:hypothetical protein
MALHTVLQALLASGVAAGVFDDACAKEPRCIGGVAYTSGKVRPLFCTRTPRPLPDVRHFLTCALPRA